MGCQRPPLPSRHQLPCRSMRPQASSHHMRMSHTGQNTHPPGGGEGGGKGSGGWGREHAASRVDHQYVGKNGQSAPERADEAAKRELTQALIHGKRGPHAWALGDCGTLGRYPSTHTPHRTPHTRTLGQHIGGERGHPPAQGPHQQSVSRETKGRAVGGGGSRRSWSQ